MTEAVRTARAMLGYKSWRYLHAESFRPVIAALVEEIEITEEEVRSWYKDIKRIEKENQGLRAERKLLRRGIFDVIPTMAGWDVKLGPTQDDPWVSVSNDYPEPQVGQIATVLPPTVVSIEPAGDDFVGLVETK